MIFEQIKTIAPPGTIIPKPQAKGHFYIKGMGKQRKKLRLVMIIEGLRAKTQASSAIVGWQERNALRI